MHIYYIYIYVYSYSLKENMNFNLKGYWRRTQNIGKGGSQKWICLKCIILMNELKNNKGIHFPILY